MKGDLLQNIYQQEEELGEILPVVTLELFFEGNDDIGSIGCNLLEHPGTKKFYDVLKVIRNRFDVQDVLVEIMEYEEETWPFSERVYIITSAKKEEIEKWVNEIQVNDVGEGYEYGQPKIVPKLKEGYFVYSIWWD